MEYNIGDLGMIRRTCESGLNNYLVQKITLLGTVRVVITVVSMKTVYLSTSYVSTPKVYGLHRVLLEDTSVCEGES